VAKLQQDHSLSSVAKQCSGLPVVRDVDSPETTVPKIAWDEQKTFSMGYSVSPG
jgi:hypothetical protein